MTVREVLEMTMNDLEAIEVPVKLSEKIGVSVLCAARNIRQCINAIDEAQQKNEEAQQTEPEAPEEEAQENGR